MREHEDEDERLAEAFRAGLQGRADQVDSSAPLVAGARASARRRRRGRLVTGLAATTAAVLVTVVALQGSGGSGGAGRDDSEQVADGDSPEAGPLPTEWRTEAWHGLQVEVPWNWGWGGAPDACGVGAVLGYLYGERSGWAELNPYVGRPISNTDACGGLPDPPVADYVWLDPDWPLGIQDLGSGYTSETVDVDGTRLTVTTDNPALRRYILESARVPEGCEPSLDTAPTVDSMLMEGMRKPSSAQVCAYRREAGAPTWDLVYATTLGKKDTAAYHAHVYDGGFESSPEFCGEGYDERVLITIVGDDPYGGSEVTQATVVDPACRQVQGAPGMVTPLSEAGMESWSKNGLKVTLYGLIGPMG